MIGVDTSSFVDFNNGIDSEGARLVRQAIIDERLVMPPFVVTELLSAKNLTDEEREAILDVPQLPIKLGLWERAGDARATILRAGKKARTLDTMIAIYCIDHHMPIITNDSDFRHFSEYFGLVILSEK